MSGKGKANPKAAAKPAAPLSKKAKKDKDEESKAAAAAAADDDAMSSGTESDDIDDDGDDSDDDSDDGLDMTREGGDDEEEEESEDEDEDNVVNVEFNFMDPREIHFKSVRRLLEHYLPGEEETFNVSAMADAIVAQTAVGTMVTVNDDLDVYSFATVLPVALYKDTDWLASIRKYVLAKARDAAANGQITTGEMEKLTSVWEDPAGSGLGLLLNERVVNMPPELAPAVHDSLARDLEWAKANAASEGVKAAFAGLKTLALLAPCFSEKASEQAIRAHAAAVADAGAHAAGRKAGKARKPRHAKAAAPSSSSSSSSSSAAAESEGADEAAEEGSSSSSSSSSAAAAGSGYNSSTKDPLGLGAGWLTHYLHFEEELFASQATTSYAFRVKDFSKESAELPQGDIGASSSVEGAGAGGKKRKAAAAASSSSSSSSSSSAAAVPVEDVPGEPQAKSLRAPASRRVVAFPAAALPVCVDAMKHLLVEAQTAAQSAAEASAGGK